MAAVGFAELDIRPVQQQPDVYKRQHQIKGVAQLAARGIGGVMRKGVLVVVDHQSARGAAADERISVVLFRRRITVREDMRQHIGNGMRPAECADDPALFSRIFLFAGSVPDARCV